MKYIYRPHPHTLYSIKAIVLTHGLHHGTDCSIESADPTIDGVCHALGWNKTLLSFAALPANTSVCNLHVDEIYVDGSRV